MNFKNRLFHCFLAAFIFLLGIIGNAHEIGLDEDLNSPDPVACFQLANYHFSETKCYRKAIYWCEQGANQGSSDCMYLLRNSFSKGIGVVQDTAEGLKWLFLAAAAGNQTANDEIDNLESLTFKIACIDPKANTDHNIQWKEGKKRATDWMNKNKKLFSNPD